MAKGGKKYRLLLYEYMLNRWWPTTLMLALALFIWGGVAVYFNGQGQNPLLLVSYDDGILLLLIGGFILLATIFLLMIRKMAYVQLFSDHMKLATPFLRLNISYKRIRLTTPTQVSDLFPPIGMSGHKREIIAPISGNTAVVVHLTSYPLARAWLKLFLSPFFFYNRTPHLVLIVDDWMRFSGEMESRRVSGKMPAPRKARKSRITSGLLDNLRKK